MDKRQSMLDALAKLKEDIAGIDARYSNTAAYASFKEQEAHAGKVVAKTTGKKRGQPKSINGGVPVRSPRVEDYTRFVKMRNITPRYNKNANCDLVKFFLYQSLRSIGYEFIISEFSYMRSIMDTFAVQYNRATEFEIKLSREDYLNDFSKSVYIGFPCNKHTHLAAGKSIISRFFFVVPENMIDVRECPNHCGLIWFKVVKYSKIYPRKNKKGEAVIKNPYSAADLVQFRVVKPAPLLTTEFIPALTYKTIANRLYSRLQNMTDRYAESLFAKIYKAAINESNVIPGPVTTGAITKALQAGSEEQKNNNPADQSADTYPHDARG